MSHSRFNPGYRSTLKGHDLKRYEDLMALCEGMDPYDLVPSMCYVSENFIPSINIIHILNYCVNTTRVYSMTLMKNYKALEAHQLLTRGWVQSIHFLPVSGDKIICLGEVKHSQSVSVTPCKCWCLVEREGDVLAAWCTCAAGASQCCSHVGAVLFALVYGAEERDSTACTSKACSWLNPALEDVPPSEVNAINYNPPEKKIRLMSQEDEENIDDPVPANRRIRCPVPKADMDKFLEDLYRICPDAVIFRVIQPYASQYMARGGDTGSATARAPSAETIPSGLVQEGSNQQT